MSSSSGAAGLLGRQLKQMQTDKDIPGISCGLVSDHNMFEWDVMLMIDDEIKFYGGTVHALLHLFLLTSKLTISEKSQEATSAHASNSPPNTPSDPLPSLSSTRFPSTPTSTRTTACSASPFCTLPKTTSTATRAPQSAGVPCRPQRPSC